jgi:predicted RNase H-like HicB family nuclease
MGNPKLTIVLEYSEEDDCIIARVQELKGCAAHGATRAEALAVLAEAMDLLEQDGADLPV